MIGWNFDILSLRGGQKIWGEFSVSYPSFLSVPDSIFKIFQELGPISKFHPIKKLQFFSATRKYSLTFEIRHIVGGDRFSNILINGPICAEGLTFRTF